ncbi:GH25 family lysozyme [Apilactobacillus xinyiensis]|uniref:GH25 family lysozyme n=1 Tax=Apilactobacillus xinyiensis TaxID=2841032 RepID=UPI0033651E92
MVEKFADVSNWQWKDGWTNADYIYWLRKVRDKYNIKSTAVLFSDGLWKQPHRNDQAVDSYKLFKSFSCYHFLRETSPTEQAKTFVSALKEFGADKNTVVACDAEVALPNLTARINEFNDYVYNAGYHHIYVYSSASFFNYNSNGIQVGKLHHSPKLWIASIGTTIRPKGCHAWQFTWTANVLGQNVDMSYDYVGELSHGVNNDEPTYIKSGKLFKTKPKVMNVYKDENLKELRRSKYGRGSKIYGKIVKVGKVTRIETEEGYISGNTDYVTKVM